MQGEQQDAGSSGQKKSGKTDEEKANAKKERERIKRETKANLLEIMDGLDHPWGKFPRRFHVVRDKSGASFIIEKDKDDMVWVSSNEAVEEALTKYLMITPQAKYPAEQAGQLVKLWANRTKNINQDDIAVVRRKSEPGLCWHRLTFDFSEGKTPYWDEILSRMSNAKAFSAWMGSLLDPHSDRVQYLYLHGDGDNSKGLIIEVEAEIFGQAFRAEVPPFKNQPDRFWKFGLLGSRLVAFSDCDKSTFNQSGEFKSLTGDSYHRMEAKGKPVFSGKLNCKFLFASNEKPDISGSIADTKRIILCELEPVSEDKKIPRSVILKHLKEELPHFLHRAEKDYKETLLPSGRIPVESEITSRLVSESEERFESLIHDYFVLEPGATALGSEMQYFYGLSKLFNGPGQSAFKNFLKRKGVTWARVGGKRLLTYFGIRLNDKHAGDYHTITYQKASTTSEKAEKLDGLFNVAKSASNGNGVVGVNGHGEEEENAAEVKSASQERIEEPEANKERLVAQMLSET